MEVDVGPADQVPADRCVAVGDGRAIVVRVGEEVVAFTNRCLHQDSPLEDGRVFDGLLVCPQHFWRYRLPSGRHANGLRHLPRFAVTVRDGRAYVDLPDPEPAVSLRDRLLAHARDWDRGDA